MPTYVLRLVAVVSIVLIGGCASEPVILPAGTHAATTPDTVQILQSRPKKYEQLGTVRLDITSDKAWDAKGETNAAFESLKQKAAALGANALLLWAPPAEHDILATAGYKGTFYQVPIKREMPRRTAVAQAVYVIQK